MNRIEIQIIEIKIIQTTYHETIHIIDQTIIDQMITIRTDQELIHEIGTLVITEIIPSHLIGILTVTPIVNIDIELTQQSFKDKSIKYKQTKKQLQTPQVLIIPKIMNYN